MKTLLKTAAVAAILTGFANSAFAMEYTPLSRAEGVMQSVNMEHTDLSYNAAKATLITPKLKNTKIAVARLYNGRFLPTPHQEASAWSALNGSAKDGATAPQFSQLSAAAHFDIIPELPMGSEESDNKIDEIRMAAVESGSDYVLIYATGKGAFWASFGGRPLEQTGLVVDEASSANLNGDAKALLIKARSGEVVGAVTTFAPDMATLTKLVGEMTAKVFDEA